MSTFSPRQRLMLIVGIVLIVVFGVGTVALILLAPTQTRVDYGVIDPSFESGVTESVTVIDPPRPVTDFTLTSAAGQPSALRDLRGGYTLLFFGFTHCPDVCPLTLAKMKRVKNELGADAERLNVLFISVDPERDTPEVMADFVTRFDPTFIGVPGQPETLAQIAGDYNLVYTLEKSSPNDTDYNVSHTSSSFLIDPNGALTAIFTYSAEPDAIVAEIQRQIAAS